MYQTFPSSQSGIPSLEKLEGCIGQGIQCKRCAKSICPIWWRKKTKSCIQHTCQSSPRTTKKQKLSWIQRVFPPSTLSPAAAEKLSCTPLFACAELFREEVTVQLLGHHHYRTKKRCRFEAMPQNSKALRINQTLEASLKHLYNNSQYQNLCRCCKMLRWANLLFFLPDIYKTIIYDLLAPFYLMELGKGCRLERWFSLKVICCYPNILATSLLFFHFYQQDLCLRSSPPPVCWSVALQLPSL